MAGTGVMPLVACLLRYAVVLLNEFHLPLGLKQFQHQRNCCPHDATPDDERIDLLRILFVQLRLRLSHV